MSISYVFQYLLTFVSVHVLAGHHPRVLIYVAHGSWLVMYRNGVRAPVPDSLRPLFESTSIMSTSGGMMNERMVDPAGGTVLVSLSAACGTGSSVELTFPSRKLDHFR